MRWSIFILLLLPIVSCVKDIDKPTLQHLKLMETPKGFPNVIHPIDNQFSIARWKLGKKLFYDPIMSSDKSISCASCHDPSMAFSDDIPVSLGVKDRKGRRNSPSLANVAYHPYYTREGGVPTLEMQVLVPIQEHDEFDDNIVLIAQRLNKDTTYVKEALIAYDRIPDPFVITRALACFERSLLSGASKYDEYATSHHKAALSDNEIRGMKLFFGTQTHCTDCHSGFNFTDYSFKNNGLYESYTDVGRYRLTKQEKDIALFKVPSLRNVALTAPYMHDGSLQTLEQVVEHYSRGGSTHPHNNIKAINLTTQEKSDLVAFLKSLTDIGFTTNPIFHK